MDRLLGEGGFGKVYLGDDTRLGRKVAIKVLNQEISEAADSAGAAFDEAKALAGVDHPHVVPVYDAGKTVEGQVFVVSKFIEGCTLDEALNQGRLTREEFLKRVLEVCQALKAVHEAGIIHRDIKPDNILLDADGKAVLIDFGIAATLDGAKWLRQAGTPKYMSPEQARGQDHLVDFQSDLYSLGAVLFRGLLGDTLKEGQTGQPTSEESALMMEIRLDGLDEQLTSELAAICQKALAVPKSDRYQSANAFAKDLEHALSANKESGRVSEDVPVVPRGLRSFGEEDAGFFLKLLPGRREPSSGLPSSIHRWKTRIEDRGLSGSEPFRVGLLYGPSGSGKSSFLKAGLLPQLDDSIIVVRFDASAGETEEHFKKILCTRFPHLDSSESLGWLLGSLRRGGLPAGEKLLIVIDQFEQWLHAHPDRISTSVLTKALRQCDGSRIQALITLRDEFWRPVSRLMSELDAPMRQRENIALVEPFDLLHGRRVLESLGRGLGCLEGELKRNQVAFLDQAIELVSDGRQVSPLRLSLLAQIFEKREWTPEALAGIHTEEDLGSVYLDQAFYGEDSPLRGRQEQAKKFLTALMPGKESVIRGAGVGIEDLRKKVEGDDREFDELVRLLDRELRLITPMASESGQCYQLSHDYLVRALRHWFSEAQKKSLRGLAMWRLEDQTEAWLAGDRKKLLPGFKDWLWFRLMTPRAARSPEARQLMKEANRKYHRRLLAWSGGMTVFAVALGWWVLQGRARDSVDQLLAARPVELERALRKAEGLSGWTKDLLREEFDRSEDLERKVRSGVLLAQDGQKYQSSVVEGLLRAGADEVEAILPRLRPFTEETRAYLEKQVFVEEHPERGIRAACALVGCGVKKERWEERSGVILDWLESVHGGRDWAAMLVPAVPHFEERLAEKICEGGHSHAFLLGSHHKDDLDRLLEMLSECKPSQIPVVQEFVGKHAQGLSRCLEIAKDEGVSHDQRARAIAVLLKSGSFPQTIALDDFNLNAQVIYQSSEVGSADLLRYVKASRNDEVWLRVFLLLLKGKEKELILPAHYRDLKALVDQLYSTHPYAGVHSAAELLLRTWEEELPEEKDGEDSEWFFCPDNGMTFVIFDPPNPLRYGAKSFAMATSELSEMAVKLENSRAYTNGGSAYRSAPASGYKGIMALCNYLSGLEGLEECYEVVGMTKGDHPQKIWMPRKDHIHLKGYRIPTEEEWLWACMQDSEYPGIYGENSPEIVPLFAWCLENSGKKQQGGRDLYPSMRGLFDVAGNYREVMLREVPHQDWGDDEKKNYQILDDYVFVGGGTYETPLNELNVFDDRKNRQRDSMGLLGPTTLRLVRTWDENERRKMREEAK